MCESMQDTVSTTRTRPSVRTGSRLSGQGCEDLFNLTSEAPFDPLATDSNATDQRYRLEHIEGYRERPIGCPIFLRFAVENLEIR